MSPAWVGDDRYTEGVLRVWRPSTLTRDQLEERRLYAQQLLATGEISTKEIAETLGVSESTVRTWKQRLREHGSLKATQAPGPPQRLSPEQRAQLEELLREGPLAAGYPDSRWTTPRVRAIIGTHFDVWYHADHVRTVLHQLGFSPQKPEPRALERNEQAIQTWVEHTLPELEKKVEQGATLVFLDESGFSLKPTVTRTWAPRGQTPILRTKAAWDKLSTIGAITTSGQFLQHTHSGAIRGAQVVAFCQHLLRHVQGEFVVLMDNARIHKTKALRAFVEQQPRLTIEYLPPYAPDLNPIERVWAYIKGPILGNFCAKDIGELKGRLKAAWQRVRYVQLPQRLARPYRASQT
nr:IS630-like element ISDge17 family transposase [Deinococcus geothermalis]